MKRYQSGAEKRKKIKKDQEVVESQRNALHKFFIVESGPTFSGESRTSPEKPKTFSNGRVVCNEINEKASQLHDTAENDTDFASLFIYLLL